MQMTHPSLAQLSNSIGLPSVSVFLTGLMAVSWGLCIQNPKLGTGGSSTRSCDHLWVSLWRPPKTFSLIPSQSWSVSVQPLHKRNPWKERGSEPLPKATPWGTKEHVLNLFFSCPLHQRMSPTATYFSSHRPSHPEVFTLAILLPGTFFLLNIFIWFTFPIQLSAQVSTSELPSCPVLNYCCPPTPTSFPLIYTTAPFSLQPWSQYTWFIIIITSSTLPRAVLSNAVALGAVANKHIKSSVQPRNWQVLVWF